MHLDGGVWLHVWDGSGQLGQFGRVSTNGVERDLVWFFGRTCCGSAIQVYPSLNGGKMIKLLLRSSRLVTAGRRLAPRTKRFEFAASRNWRCARRPVADVRLVSCQNGSAKASVNAPKAALS